MTLVSHAVFAFKVPSMLLQGTTTEAIQSVKLWYMKGRQGPYEFSAPEENIISADTLYRVYTQAVPEPFVIGDILSVFSILRTDEGVYRTKNQVIMSVESDVEHDIPITHPLAIPAVYDTDMTITISGLFSTIN
tara:strand:+ start:563 stop:964 length:402 start_codon:yes stop_codon:yes gene_type:complete